MDINWLEDFVCLARTLNFTRAAEERNVTQSAFSRRIQSLELWVGAELVDRKSFPAILSDAGKEFLPIAKSTLNDLMRSRDELRAKESAGNDTIRFTAPHSVSTHNLMPLLAKLESAIPDLRSRVTSDNLHNCCDRFTGRNCDFLMCYRHSTIPIELDERRFERLDIGNDKLVPVYSASLQSAPVNWQLPGEQDNPISYLQFDKGSFLGSVIEQKLHEKKPHLKLRHTDAFGEALKSLCLQGAGLAWLPHASIEKELVSTELICAGDEKWQIPLTLSIFAEPETFSNSGQMAWDFFHSL